MGCRPPRMAMNAAQHKIINLLKTFFFFCSSVFISVCVFNVWPMTTLLPVWPRDAKRLDTLEWLQHQTTFDSEGVTSYL